VIDHGDAIARSTERRQRRAEAVMKALSLLGVPADRMEAVSYGEEKPRRTDHDEASWAENRRDDLVIQAGK